MLKELVNDILNTLMWHISRSGFLHSAVQSVKYMLDILQRYELH